MPSKRMKPEGVSPAEAKARELLATFVDPEDFRRYLVSGGLEVHGSDGGRFLVRPGKSDFELDAMGTPISSWCAHADGKPNVGGITILGDDAREREPPSDEVLSKLLHLRHSEANYRIRGHAAAMQPSIVNDASVSMCVSGSVRNVGAFRESMRKKTRRDVVNLGLSLATEVRRRLLYYPMWTKKLRKALRDLRVQTERHPVASVLCAAAALARTMGLSPDDVASLAKEAATRAETDDRFRLRESKEEEDA